MGFLRKTFIVSTGGLGRAVVKPNSKKERVANAADKQLKLEEKQLKLEEKQLRAEQRSQAAALKSQRDAGRAQQALERRHDEAKLETQRQSAALDGAGQSAFRGVVPTTAPAPAPTPLPTGLGQVSVADELKKLAELRDAGILSQEEFESQKARLLDS